MKKFYKKLQNKPTSKIEIIPRNMPPTNNSIDRNDSIESDNSNDNNLSIATSNWIANEDWNKNDSISSMISNNCEPIQSNKIKLNKIVHTSDINWHVKAILGHRPNPKNKSKTQYLVEFIDDDHFEFDKNELKEWQNLSMMDCLESINDYRIANNMHKIKKISRKRTYIGDDMDITASQVDFDFISKNYKTNQNFVSKRSKLC